MKQPESFPYEHKVAGLIFQIYSAPLKKVQANGTEKEYPSFLVYHQVGANAVCKRRSSWQKVEAYIEEVVAAARASDPERLE